MKTPKKPYPGTKPTFKLTPETYCSDCFVGYFLKAKNLIEYSNN